MINSHTQLLGLIGYPARHSLSPLMHNAVFKNFKINAVYLVFEFMPSLLKNALEGLQALGVRGLNVTVPFKEKVIAYINDLEDKPGLAKKIGAVNTLLNQKTGLVGYNTDGIGFIQSLERLKFSPLEKKVLLLGAGGAGKAVSFSLAQKKIKSLFIFDINFDRATALAEKLKNHFSLEIQPLKTLEKEKVKESDLLINATPVGLKRKDTSLVSSRWFHSRLVVYDLIYNPSQTPLLRSARKKGLNYTNGLWMLIYQAKASLDIWFEELRGKDTVKIMYRTLKREGFKSC